MMTEKAIEGFRNFVETHIAYAQVSVGGTTVKEVIHRKERLKDGRVALYIAITPQLSRDAKVTRVQLYDTNNDLWVDKKEDILLRAVQEGVLYRFTFDFKEVVRSGL